MQARGFLNDCLKYFCPKVIHFICQPIELQQEIKQKAGGHGPPSPLIIATALIKYKLQFCTPTTRQLHVKHSIQWMLPLCPQTCLLHHKRKKNGQALLFLVTEESMKLGVNKCYKPLLCSSIQFCLQKARRYRDNAIAETGWKIDRTKNGSMGKSVVLLCFHFYFRGFKPLLGVSMTPAAPRGGVIGAVNPFKHLEPLILSVLLDILQQVSSDYFPSWSSSVLGWPFWGRLAGVPHHLKRLALAI